MPIEASSFVAALDSNARSLAEAFWRGRRGEVRSSDMAVRFHHAHLFATDLDASLEFYRRWFGAEVVADREFGGARNVMVRIGDGQLNFYQQPPRDLGRNAIHHLGFQVTDLSGLVAEMAEGGVEFRTPIRELPELDYVMVAAPDNVLLELFEYTQPPGHDAELDSWFGWVGAPVTGGD